MLENNCYLTDGEIDLILIESTFTNINNENIPIHKYIITLHHNKVIIGTIDIILGYNDSIYYSGNIGFEIIKAYRGNNYAFKATKLIKTVALNHGMKRLYICCNPTNIASRTICEKLGAKLKTITIIPNSHYLYNQDEKMACIYILYLK